MKIETRKETTDQLSPQNKNELETEAPIITKAAKPTESMSLKKEYLLAPCFRRNYT